MKSLELLAKLRNSVNEMVSRTEAGFAGLPEEILNRKPHEGAWSILECYEHLNRYLRYYNPAIAKKLSPGHRPVDEEVQSTWLGRKSIESMHPSNQKKQKTFRHMNPANSALEAVVITEFLGHQQELLRMLVVAERCNINTARVPVEFFKLLRLTLGETFQFVIHHQERHFLQLNRTLAAVSNTSAAALIV